MIKLLKSPTFSLFFFGNIISLVGFGFNIISISWLVLQETGSEFALGKIMATATTPGLIMALFSGIIIDKLNRKWLLIILDIFRTIVILIFLITISFKGFKLFYIYPLVIFMGLGNSLFWPTAQAFVQEGRRQASLLTGEKGNSGGTSGANSNKGGATMPEWFDEEQGYLLDQFASVSFQSADDYAPVISICITKNLV